MTGRRRAGRPLTAVLSVDGIAAAGLALLDERGDFSMAELARALGVQASALYNHVAGKDEVLARVRELVSDRIDVGVFDRLGLEEALPVWARSYRIAFSTHPVTVALFATLPVVRADRTIAMYERVIRAFAEAGWPEEDILTTVVALENLILGSALDVVAPDDMLDPAGAAAAPAFVAAYAAQRAALGRARPADAAFEAGLAAMLLGLRARLGALRGA
ncbi:TetR/AcrR family transcriptional regulator C-terminal domain-containing protein [Nocardioides sp. BP30]|uniref:TetR/AcrR family transcriptional regulator n=1 Tax=Nocardioides sp. BP30 TaxID=3036374 RepID=UPI0024693487|nr:TetR/AcrR family transcriptional regulator C-terminal domain-containing protein [Nocardioides sp. BP30]WGL51663.1 TetR/AcrR family transcriptional regulator C-terminal domain-containing protein [Nocardioides sp. BP30]